MLTAIADGLWTETAPLSMMGLHLGTRMTLVCLPGGGLLVHSPTPLTAERREAVARLGTVTHVVAPNTFHHLYAGQWTAAFPEATLHAPAALGKKRPDLRIGRLLSEPPHPDLSGVLEPLAIEGTMLAETVFVHTPSRTLVSSDLVENHQSVEHLPTRLYLRLSGAYQRVAWPRPLRIVYRDRRAARHSVDALLEREFDRALVAHGELIESGAREAIRAALGFLG